MAKHVWQSNSGRVFQSKAEAEKERFEINQAINFIKKQRETAKKEREEAKLWENGENGSWLDKEQYKSFHGC